jgi:hypothetical protein
VTPRPVSSLLCALLVTASCLPAPDVAQLVLDDDDDVLVLFIHGAGPGEDPSVWADATAADVVGALDEDGVVGVRVHAWDWSARSGTRELAPSAAGDEGRAIADVITDSAVSHVHVVAHSAGAGVATALVEGLVDAGGTTTTHLTLLDPFSLFGVVDCGRATVCEAWRNSDDGAPGSDAPVPTAFNVDVTAARPSSFDERAHWWPTEAWRLTIAARAQPGFGGSVEAGVDIDALADLLPRSGGD